MRQAFDIEVNDAAIFFQTLPHEFESIGNLVGAFRPHLAGQQQLLICRIKMNGEGAGKQGHRKSSAEGKSAMICILRAPSCSIRIAARNMVARSLSKIVPPDFRSDPAPGRDWRSLDFILVLSRSSRAKAILSRLNVAPR